MSRFSLALTITLCGLYVHLTEAQRILPVKQFQPNKPFRSPFQVCGRVINGERVKYISDLESRCHFWSCTVSRTNFKSNKCGLGTHVSDLYAFGSTNPCTEANNQTHGFINPLNNQDGVQFDCTRKKRPIENEVPACVVEFEQTNRCRNGGSIANDVSKCWCVCTERWSGHICTTRRVRYSNFDFNSQHPTLNRLSRPFVNNALRHIINSRVAIRPPSPVAEPAVDIEPKRIPNAPRVDGPFPQGFPVPVFNVEPRIINGKFVYDDPCPNAPAEDFCRETINGEPFCLNGGTCVNQCLGAVCLCPPLFTAGRRCEIFSCQEKRDCMNGGECTRGGMAGVEGWNNDPIFNCICPARWGGKMCEIAD